ncbi:unnamed protein product [Discula destructiva]
MSSKSSKKRDAAPAKKITDSRFASFETDPRYALPSKRKSKTTIDKRFSRMLKDDEFTATAKVDRYGRKIKSDSKKRALQRLYQEEGKSDCENDDDDDDDDEEEDEADEEAGELEVEADEIVQRELLEAEKKYDPARGGGFSSSEDDSESEEDSEDEEVPDNAPDMQRYQTEQADVETGEVTNRLAIVNLDWDHMKSVDLMALFTSFVPIGGRIEKISIYPSEFGKERMQREELEGPPKEIFKKSADEEEGEEDDSEDEDENDKDDAEDSDEEAKKELLQEGNDEDFDHDALRTYQLDRLRYYYAIMICSDKNTAHKIYEATDGNEYLSSSNFLDLRFVPDDVTFDEEPRDECDTVPNNYKPIEFVTDALQHSKVKLTWDMHPEEASRKETMKNAFSGSRTEIAENDLKAYLASDSEGDEEDEEEEEPAATEAADAPKLSKKELARKKMREALGLKDEPEAKSSKSAAVGDMQITFAPALTEAPKKDPENETTAEKYIRKEREKKAAKKEAYLARREGAKPAAEEEAQEDLGFEDPFFAAEEPKKATKSSLLKKERLKKREKREAREEKNKEERAELELLMADSNGEEDGHLDHFDMNEIMKAEKLKKKKSKGKKNKKDAEDAAGLQEDFKMDVDDDRFTAVFQDHEFAIDPSNPKFKATSGMKKLLEEGRKKRKQGGDDAGEERSDKRTKKARAAGGGKDDLTKLVSSLKKKSGSSK